MNNKKAIKQISAIWLLQSMINSLYDDFCTENKLNATKQRQCLRNIAINQKALIDVFKIDFDKGSEIDKKHFSEDFEHLEKLILKFIEE